ncbi:zinc finger protein ZAT9-like [Trifolium pratense]|uniref:Zinc finger protein ZAT9-like n=1 Tax=Trifolium pratense TaxID=57577 RepID=A0A2K3PGD3_TRIPR|nr:zinc finger protein ZAT9-like [Trifolium pratense]
MKSKKSKEHECLICNKIVMSRQALGGHKRSHFVVGNIDENTFVIRPANGGVVQVVPAANPCLIDLNLPAPDDDKKKITFFAEFLHLNSRTLECTNLNVSL